MAKNVQAFCLLLAVAGYIYCEICTVNNDCSSTNCNSNYHKICQHPNPSDGITTGGGLCTCAINDYSCTTQSDCNITALICVTNDHRHCYDGKCICTRW